MDTLNEKGGYKNVFKLSDGKAIISPANSIATTSASGVTKLTTTLSKQPSIMIKSNTLKPLLGSTNLTGMINRSLTVKKINVINPGQQQQLQQQLKNKTSEKKDPA